jgi:hypothetical protein
MLNELKKTEQIGNILLVILCWQALNVFTDSFLMFVKYTLLNLSTNIYLVFTVNIIFKIIFVFLSIYIVQIFIFKNSLSRMKIFSILSFYVSSLFLSYYIFEIMLYFFNNKIVSKQNNLYNDFLAKNLTINFLNLYLETIMLIIITVYFLFRIKKNHSA